MLVFDSGNALATHAMKACGLNAAAYSQYVEGNSGQACCRVTRTAKFQEAVLMVRMARVARLLRARNRQSSIISH